MDLRRTLAVPYRQHGRERLAEPAFVTALAIERDWFTPDEVRRLLERGLEAGELERDGDHVVPTFEVGEVVVPTGYEPPDDLTTERPTFERMVDTLEADGHDRRRCVAEINELQDSLAVPSDVAAVVYAHERGIDVSAEATRVRRGIEADRRS